MTTLGYYQATGFDLQHKFVSETAQCTLIRRALPENYAKASGERQEGCRGNSSKPIPEMKSGAEEDLLRMSLTGAFSPESQRAFDAEKDLGNAAFREQRYIDAIQHYTNAENINPLSPVPPANRAMAHLKLSNYQNAKADAAVALELHHALPKHLQSASLPVKILLRRATANFELLLYALAAEDFAAVLQLDPTNQPATAQLKLLKEKFGVVPGKITRPGGRSSARDGSKYARSNIQLLSESVNGSSSPRQTPQHIRATNRGFQNETALVELPQNVMDTLISKWSAEPPRTTFEFERAWKSLRSDRAALANYLVHTVGSQRLANGLLGESLTPEKLEEIVTMLKVAVDISPANSRAVADILQALTKVSRFEMLLMFFSDQDKQPILALVEALSTHGVPTEQILTLKECYS